jgi:cytochrome c-type biogenesis protein CcmE
MNRRHKQKLIWIIIIFLLVASAIGLVLYALKQNINLFYSPSQVAKGLAPVNRNFRLGGLVTVGSVHKDPESLRVNFSITDKLKSIPVEYTGVLPDLFKENQSVVVEGQLSSKGHFVANQVLAKHDEKYMPKEVKEIFNYASSP